MPYVAHGVKGAKECRSKMIRNLTIALRLTNLDLEGYALYCRILAEKVKPIISIWTALPLDLIIQEIQCHNDTLNVVFFSTAL